MATVMTLYFKNEKYGGFFRTEETTFQEARRTRMRTLMGDADVLADILADIGSEMEKLLTGSDEEVAHIRTVILDRLTECAEEELEDEGWRIEEVEVGEEVVLAYLSNLSADEAADLLAKALKDK